MRPLVTVLTANYNYGHYVEQAIESVLAQTYPNFELIICDDGSLDDSVTRITPYTESNARIKLLIKDNAGQASAWNVAYANSNGSIICILDSDDVFAPNKLEEIVNTFQRYPDVGLVIHPMLVIDAAGAELRQVPPFPQFEHGWRGPQVLARGGRWNAMYGSALCFRREVAQLVFPIPEQYFKVDADSFIMRIGPLVTSVSSSSYPLTRYRSHGHNSTHANINTDPMDAKQLHLRMELLAYRARTVNHRLAEAGLADRLLPISRSPFMEYWISLLDGSGFGLRVQRLLPLLIYTIRTEMSAPVNLVGKGAIYSIALFLPRARRAALMHRFFSLHAYTHRSRPWQSWTWACLRSRISRSTHTAVATGIAHVAGRWG
jgi:glycosyltransferase involved in cell wall biosynthesis